MPPHWLATLLFQLHQLQPKSFTELGWVIQRRTRLEEVGWGPGDRWEEEDSTFRVLGLGGTSSLLCLNLSLLLLLA